MRAPAAGLREAGGWVRGAAEGLRGAAWKKLWLWENDERGGDRADEGLRLSKPSFRNQVLLNGAEGPGAVSGRVGSESPLRAGGERGREVPACSAAGVPQDGAAGRDRRPRGDAERGLGVWGRLAPSVRKSREKIRLG